VANEVKGRQAGHWVMLRVALLATVALGASGLACCRPESALSRSSATAGLESLYLANVFHSKLLEVIGRNQIGVVVLYGGAASGSHLGGLRPANRPDEWYLAIVGEDKGNGYPRQLTTLFRTRLRAGEVKSKSAVCFDYRGSRYTMVLLVPEDDHRRADEIWGELGMSPLRFVTLACQEVEGENAPAKSK